MKEYIVRNKKRFVVGGIIVFLILLSSLSIILIVNYNKSKVKEEVVLEVGSKLPTEKVFLLNNNKKIEFITDINKVEIKTSVS